MPSEPVPASDDQLQRLVGSESNQRAASDVQRSDAMEWHRAGQAHFVKMLITVLIHCNCTLFRTSYLVSPTLLVPPTDGQRVGASW